jgi:putative polyhydroxyalkanoate system protein
MRIRRQHHFELHEAHERINVLAADLEKRFMLRSHWDSENRLVFDGGGATGEVLIDEESVELNAKLSFALKLIEPTLRAVIEETLDEQIGGAAPGDS